MGAIYSTLRWKAARSRALSRDGHRCTIGRYFLGEPCSGPLHVHHIHAVSDGGAPFDLDNLGTSCEKHHPKWEALCRALRREPELPRCSHYHRSAEGRRQCEARLARAQRAAA